MEYEWDGNKCRDHLAKHGVDFTAAEELDWDSARIVEDTRFSYGEPRWIAYGTIGQRLHVIAFTLRGGAVRIISLRKANRREVYQYAKKT